jgi:hypothetical protein
VSKYYHVIHKNGAWHLYAGNAPSALATDVQRSQVIKVARSLARQDGAKIVIHKEEGPKMTYGSTQGTETAAVVRPAGKN